ncbi:MAG TPA: hypothetical protein VER39_06520, partial [Nocardioidaceae bacterium]|nr:hypothetical protein [Nocardioidaceae bacterium]
MTSEPEPGVAFPRTPEGRRSTSALGRAVIADALRAVDPAGARAAEQETSWRTGYLPHFRRAIETGVGSPAAAVSIAAHGLASLHDRMRVVGRDGAETTLDDWVGGTTVPDTTRSGTTGLATGLATAPPIVTGLRTVEVRGSTRPEAELSLPYRGERLRGDGVHRRLDAWVAAGVLEPSAAEAVRTVLRTPGWLRLEGRTVAVLGAGAEMGPLPALLRWGAHTAAVDLPVPQVWQRVLATARPSAGTALLPVPAGTSSPDPLRAGADLVSDMPAVAEWLLGVDGPLVVGNYVYADGADNVRVAMAVDALSTRLLQTRDDVALAFLATPTDVFAVPAEAVRHSTDAYAARSATAKTLGRPLRAVSAGRLLRRAYLPGADPGINDSLVPQQGPNYALAKRLQRWRATTARRGGVTVSMNVAPPTRTRSVVRNRALAAAYAGAHRFGVEVFEPAT